MTTLSLYFHIPFCRQACAYCNFYFVVSPQEQIAFFRALHNEFLLYHRFIFSNAKISSIYFGGGTPSWVDPQHITDTIALISNISQFENIEKFPETTLEVNPDDLVSDRLESYLQAGINRISLGIQSFNSSILKYLHRGHNRDQAKIALSLLSEKYKNGHLRSWSMDLIYGVPCERAWEKELNYALGISEEGREPPHISLYALTVEPKTSLEYQIKTGKKQSPLSKTARNNYLQAVEILGKRGYHHYEISNYSFAGHHSRHNSRYWEYRDYWGGGPGAHTFIGGKRYHNRSQLASYIRQFSEIDIEKINKDTFYKLVSKVRTEEVLTLKQSYNEYLMVGLRNAQGVYLTDLEKKFSSLFNRKKFIEQIQPFRDQGLILLEEEKIKINEEGWLLSDTIIQELFVIA